MPPLLAPGPINPVQFVSLLNATGTMFIRFRTALLIAGFLFGFYVPSSLGGVISRDLTIVALLGTCAVLGLLVVLPSGFTPPLGVAAGLGMLAVLIVASVVSPFDEFSPGVIFIYVAIALLYMLDLRGTVSRRGVIAAFAVMNVLSVALGAAIVLGVEPVHAVLKTYYSAFYPDLVPNMLDKFAISKPVLTFGTHSMAGFVVYVIGYLSLLAFERDGRWLGLTAAVAHLVMLALLTSTTSTILGLVLAAQIAWSILRDRPALTWFVPVFVVLIVGSAVLIAGVTLAGSLASARQAVLGDRIAGFLSRYAQNGLLTTDLRYLSVHPFRPIGFSFSNSLNLGDSGLMINLLRGSIPGMLITYGGLYAFLRQNIGDLFTARWLWVVTIAFEAGFPPLQYFRFVAALPLLVAYAHVMTSAAPASPVPVGMAR